MVGLRNRTLLLLIQVGGLMPANVAGIDRQDLRCGEGAVVLPVGQGRRHPSSRGRGSSCSIAAVTRPAGYLALERWLKRSGISYGPVFRAVTVHGRVQRRLGVVGVRRILQGIEKQADAQALPEGRRPVRALGATQGWEEAYKSSQLRRIRENASNRDAKAVAVKHGEASAAAEAAGAAVQVLVDTDWLRHTLTLSGPAAEMAAF